MWVHVIVIISSHFLLHRHLGHSSPMFSTTLDKTSWDKSLKSSEFKKWLNFSNSSFFTLPCTINVESGHVLLSKALIFANNIDFGGEGLFHWKTHFLFCLNSLVQDCCRLLIFFEKTIPSCSMAFKCMLVYCVLSIQSVSSYKSDLHELMLIFSMKIWYFRRLHLFFTK